MELWLRVVQDHPLVCVLCVSLIFRLLHRLLQMLPRPDGLLAEPWRSWKWKNLSVSLVHSLITGSWALISVIQYPAMVHDLSSTYSPSSYMLVVVSSGYFIADAADIIFSGYAKASWEFLLHHVLVLWCFLFSVFTRRYVAGAVVALFVEVNSVFLHTRLLLNLAKVSHTSLILKANKALNFLTYVMFRLGAQFYITWFLIYHYSSLDFAFYFLTTMMLMNIMILIYFYRLIRSDLLTRQRAQNGVCKLALD